MVKECIPATLDAASVKKVFGILKKHIGALRIFFGSIASKVLTANIKHIAEDVSEHCGFNDDNDKLSVLYLLSTVKNPGTEQVEYHSFLALLKEGCPKVPTDNKPFLPFLSFLCKPEKAFMVRHPINGEVGIQVFPPGLDPKDHIIPPHPKHVALMPSPRGRYAIEELHHALKSTGDASLTLEQYAKVMKEVDPGLQVVNLKRLFIEAGKSVTVDKGVVDVGTLETVTIPHLTMIRQKSRCSDQVKAAFSWSDSVGSFSTTNSLSGGSPDKVVPRTPRGIPVGKQTKSADLRAAAAREAINRVSPRYRGENIPVSPRNYKVLPVTDIKKCIAEAPTTGTAVNAIA